MDMGVGGYRGGPEETSQETSMENMGNLKGQLLWQSISSQYLLFEGPGQQGIVLAPHHHKEQ